MVMELKLQMSKQFIQDYTRITWWECDWNVDMF